MTRDELQQNAVRKWVKSGGKICISWATGCGKTRVGILIAKELIKANPDSFILIVVPTEVLKEQWTEELVKNNIFNNCQVVIINTVIKSNWDCDLMIQDEAHLFCADAMRQVFNCVQYKFLVCLTATLERLDGKEEIIRQRAPVIDIVTLQEAIANGWVSPIKEYLVLLDVDLSEYNEWNRKFQAFFSFFDYKFDVAMACATNYKYRIDYAHQMGYSVKDVNAMSMGWRAALQKRKAFIQKHPKKLEICKKILAARKDKKCITFSPTIELAKKVGADYILHSQQSKNSNKDILDKFNTAETGVIASSKALNQGVNVKGLSVGIVMNTNSSKITATQVAGRVCRFEPGKQAEMFYLVLRGTAEFNWFNNSHTRNIITINEEQLEKILNGENIETRQREFNSNVEYRF